MIYFPKDYTFQVARLRALETHFLNPGQVERMISAKTPEDSFKILYDLDWAEFITDNHKPDDFGEILDMGLYKVKKMIIEMLEDERAFNFIWGLFDLQNAKILTKAKIKGIDPDTIHHLLSPLGTVTRTEMQQIVFEKKRIVQSELDIIIWGKKQLTPFENFCDVITEAEVEYERTKDPQIIDVILNKNVLSLIMNKARKTKSLIIKSFFGRLIDIENIKFYLRRGHEADPISYEDFKNGLLDGGKIDKHFFTEIKDIHELLSHIKFLEIYIMVRDEISEDNLDFIQIEKLLDEALYLTLKPSKMEPFGPEAIFAYFWTKRRNAEIIRAIMTGKLNGVDEKTIRKWVKIPSLPLV